jgi:pyruvate formate lyase activating enzyme
MNVEKSADQGTVVQLQDYSIHDGAGVRTTLFLAGCGLRCQWCANPESWTRKTKLAYYQHKCRACLSCVAACPHGLDARYIDTNQPSCNQCNLCSKACPNKALVAACQEISVDEVYQRIERDELFFRYSGGGVTFSGGEPFLQHQFIRAIINKCAPLGISYWAETCGHFSWQQCRDLLPEFEHIFFDIKQMDSDIHRQYTGVGNQQILANACNIYQLGIPMTVRIPFMPQVNGDQHNLEQTAKFMQQHLPGTPIELLPYHELGKAKYTAFKMQQYAHSFTLPSESQLEQAYAIFKKYGIERAAQ